jgi:tRNA(Arg) A34 adenosine deaminase TadA
MNSNPKSDAQIKEKIMHSLIQFAHDKMFNHNAYPFCAFIVKDNEIIGKGFNSKVNDYGDKTMHGEMEAMKDACIKLSNGIYLEDCSLYTTCEPCLACFDACLWSKIKTFVCSVDHSDFPDYFHDHDYTIDDYLKSNPGKITYETHVLHNEGISLFKEAKQKYGWLFEKYN